MSKEQGTTLAQLRPALAYKGYDMSDMANCGWTIDTRKPCAVDNEWTIEAREFIAKEGHLDLFGYACAHVHDGAEVDADLEIEGWEEKAQLCKACYDVIKKSMEEDGCLFVNIHSIDK